MLRQVQAGLGGLCLGLQVAFPRVRRPGKEDDGHHANACLANQAPASTGSRYVRGGLRTAILLCTRLAISVVAAPTYSCLSSTPRGSA